MRLVTSIFKREKKDVKYKLEREKERILEYLKELQGIEAKLWGVIVTDLKNGEEIVLEDSNHLIYMIGNNKHDDLNRVLKLKDVKDFLEDVEAIKRDFGILKKELREKEKLKLLISNFTIKLVDANNYDKFKSVFILERKLYDVLDKQDDELEILIRDLSRIKVETREEKIEAFITSLKKIRDILSGHLDNYKYFEEDRYQYSNTSNLIHELIKVFRQDIE